MISIAARRSAAWHRLAQYHLLAEDVSRLNPHLICMGAIPIENFPGAKFAGGKCRLVKNGIGYDDLKRWIEKVIQALRHRQRNEWRGVRNDDGDFNRHGASAAAR